jgi:5'-deoxynucleotidase YfbR-like HD superfamily hydrolase
MESLIFTHTERHFDFAAPLPEQIDILDVIYGLSRECRFASQVERFYSVAEHSLLCSEIVLQEFALEALLHDAAEAYCKDIPSPLKALLPDYKAIEQRVDVVIRKKFGLPESMSPKVKLVGELARVKLWTEYEHLKNSLEASAKLIKQDKS